MKIRYAIAVVVAAAGMAAQTAQADVFLPSTGNGQLTLFVQDQANLGRVYAVGLTDTALVSGGNTTGAARIDDIGTLGEIAGDSVYQNVPQSPAEQLPSLYHFTTLNPNGLATFLAGGTDYAWGIMAGDTTTSSGIGLGQYRFASTVGLVDWSQSGSSSN